MDIHYTPPADLDQERQGKAREYARKKRWLSFLDMGIAAVGIALILGLGLDKWLRDALQGATAYIPAFAWQPRPHWLPFQTLLYFLVLMLVYQVVTIPISYYSGFILSHRYGLSVMTFKQWLTDLFKGLALGLVLEAAVVMLIYTLLAYQPQWWWLWVALVLLFFSVIMANLAPVLILPLFYKFTPLPEGELVQRLVALATRANTKVRGVFAMQMSNKTTATNAALMGLGNTRRIVLGDTMMNRYTPDEIEVVLAHELGHHVHHDIWKMLISQSILTLGGLAIANLILHKLTDGMHLYYALTDAATIPLLFLLTGLFSLLVMPLGNIYSRSMEYQADEYALQSTHKVEAFKNVMTRLANQNLTEVEPLPIIEFLFHSHPSISKRLQHANEFARRGPGKAGPRSSTDTSGARASMQP